MFEPSSFTSTGRRDTGREDAALRWLRQQPEQVRVRFAAQVVAQRYPGAHEFVRRSQLSRQSLEGLFRAELVTADASTIGLLLGAVIEGVGWRRVIALLQQQLATDVAPVERALYWLPSLLPSSDAEARQGYEELRDRCRNVAKSGEPSA